MRLTDRCPDLNPVRHLWDIMYRCIAPLTVAVSFRFKSDWCPNPDLGGVPPRGTIPDLHYELSWWNSQKLDHPVIWSVTPNTALSDLVFSLIMLSLFCPQRFTLWSIKTASSRAWCTRFCFLAVFVFSGPESRSGTAIFLDMVYFMFICFYGFYVRDNETFSFVIYVMGVRRFCV